jgi:hypothetical protein
MKIAIVGSRSITVNNLGDYLPENTTEIVSGGAIGVDRSARNYAKTHNIKLKEFLPEYERYGRSAPLKRNLQIIDYADEVIAFWDGMSHGTRFVIENCKRKMCRLRFMLWQISNVANEPKISYIKNGRAT